MKQEGKNKVAIQEIISPETAVRILEFMKQYYPYYDSKLTSRKPWWKTGFDAVDFRSKRSKINNKVKELISDPDLGDEFIISSYSSYSNTSYGIKADKRNFRLPMPH